jgi:hypothetical protein
VLLLLLLGDCRKGREHGVFMPSKGRAGRAAVLLFPARAVEADEKVALAGKGLRVESRCALGWHIDMFIFAVEERMVGFLCAIETGLRITKFEKKIDLE